MTPAPVTPAADDLPSPSPTPWTLEHPDFAQPERGHIWSRCKGFPTTQVAQATPQRTSAERMANAAFIVKAANAYEDIAALRSSLEAERAEKERLAGRLEIAERNVAANADLAGRWIAEHDRERERARTLADALRRWGMHDSECQTNNGEPLEDCDCGLKAALAALPPASAPCSAKATQGETEDRQASGWRPIETAQMDGHRILVGHVLGWTSIGSCRASGKWRHDDGSTATVAPTHWQPLPPSPALPPAEPAIDNDVTGRIRESCWGPPEGPLGDGPVATPIPKEK